MSMNIYLTFKCVFNEKLCHEVVLVQTKTQDTYFILNSEDEKKAYFEVLEKYLKELEPENNCSKYVRKEFNETKAWYKNHIREVDKLFKEFKPLIDSKIVCVDWYTI